MESKNTEVLMQTDIYCKLSLANELSKNIKYIIQFYKKLEMSQIYYL